MNSFVFNPFTGNFDVISSITLGTANGLSLVGQVLSLGLSSTSTTGALSSTDWNTFNNKQAALTIGNLTDVGTDGITVTGGTGAVIGSGTSLSQHVADSTHNGYLSSTDWSTFNSKQAAGNYITALTGDVTASGPGSVAATLKNIPNKVYVDYVLGSDSNTGTITQPWKTLQHAYSSITPSASAPFVIYLSGGANSTDTGTITGKPDTSIYSADLSTIPRPLTISGGNNDANVSFVNIVFNGAVTWSRSDNSHLTMSVENCSLNSTFTFVQTGSGVSGVSSLSAYNCVFSDCVFNLRNAGSLFYGCMYFGSTVTFADVNTVPFYIFAGGYSVTGFTFNGGPSIDFVGFIHDNTFGASTTFTTTANGTPVVKIDSSGLPPTYTGSPTLSSFSQAQYLNYTPTTSGNWNSVPATGLAALDTLASSGIVKSQTQNKVLASPNGSSGVPSFRALVAADVPAPALTSAHIFVGNGSNVATDVAMSGDVTINNTGVTAIGTNKVANSQLAQMAAHTFKGNNTGSTANASDLTAIQLSNELIIAAQAISSTAIDWATGNMFTKTLGASTTFTFSNAVSGQTIIVRLTNTASNWTVTWPSVRWSGGSPPVMTVGAFSDVYTFIYDGSNYYGSAVQNMS